MISRSFKLKLSAPKLKSMRGNLLRRKYLLESSVTPTTSLSGSEHSRTDGEPMVTGRAQRDTGQPVGRSQKGIGRAQGAERQRIQAGISRRRAKPLSRIGKKWEARPWLIVHDDGREVCNLTKAAGKKEYRLRISQMLDRQGGLCCFKWYSFCPGHLSLEEATFEHQDKRTKARRDDRIEIRDKETGALIKLINGAAHPRCNGIVGSSRKYALYQGPHEI